MHTLETYNTTTQLDTADGATTKTARENTSIYGRTHETTRYDVTKQTNKLDTQREIDTNKTHRTTQINTLSDKAHSSTISQLSRTTDQNKTIVTGKQIGRAHV